MSARVFVVDDVDLMRESMGLTLERAGYRVRTFEGPADAVAAARREPPDLVITDLRMPGMDGLDLLARLREIDPGLAVVVVTAHGTVKTAVEAMRRGAVDYLTKPFEPEELEVVAGKAVERVRLLRENRELRGDPAAAADFVGDSPSARAVRETVARAAKTDSTVLVSGESGTGKEVVARLLHAAGPRAERPFYSVNCAALSAGLLESELFGHERGAFTGADRMRRGRFELAAGGSLLLDEVSEIAPELQAKLLRVLQERTFERVGSSEPLPADVRVIATTNRDLGEAVAEGSFREDLFYRLNIVPIQIPPLRERKEDIPALVACLVERHRARGWQDFPEVTADGFEALAEHDWPGNVRELGNVLERAAVLHAPEPIAAGRIRGLLVPRKLNGSVDALVGVPLAEVEARLIEKALDRFGGSRRETARALGIAERTLRDKLKRMREGEGA